MYPHNLVMNFWSEIDLSVWRVSSGWSSVFFREVIRAMLGRRNDWLRRALAAAMAAILVHGLSTSVSEE